MADAVAQENTRFKFEAAPVRFFFPNVITPRAPEYGNGRKGDPEYSVQVGIASDHPDLKALKTLMAKVAKAKFGTLDGVAFPLKDGTKAADKGKEKKKDREFMRGLAVLKATSKQYAPALFYVAAGEVVEVDESMRSTVGAKFYHGVEGTIGVNFVAYEGNGANIPNSVKCYLGDAVSLGRGKKLGGGGKEKYADFAKNMGEVSDTDPTDTGDDDGDEISL